MNAFFSRIVIATFLDSLSSYSGILTEICIPYLYKPVSPENFSLTSPARDVSNADPILNYSLGDTVCDHFLVCDISCRGKFIVQMSSIMQLSQILHYLTTIRIKITVVRRQAWRQGCTPQFSHYDNPFVEKLEQAIRIGVNKFAFANFEESSPQSRPIRGRGKNTKLVARLEGDLDVTGNRCVTRHEARNYFGVNVVLEQTLTSGSPSQSLMFGIVLAEYPSLRPFRDIDK